MMLFQMVVLIAVSATNAFARHTKRIHSIYRAREPYAPKLVAQPEFGVHNILPKGSTSHHRGTFTQEEQDFFAIFKTATVEKINDVPRLSFKYDDDFESFLDLVEEAPPSSIYVFDKKYFKFDRKNRPYINCVHYDSKTQQKQKQVACKVILGSDRPACYFMHNKKTSHIKQGCYKYPSGHAEDIKAACKTNTKCNVHESSQVSFCCCIGERCNAEKKVLAAGITYDHIIGRNISTTMSRLP